MTNLNQSGGLLQSSKLLLLHSSIGSYAIVYDIECLDIEYSFSLHYPAALNRNNSVPQPAATTFAFASV